MTENNLTEKDRKEIRHLKWLPYLYYFTIVGFLGIGAFFWNSKNSSVDYINSQTKQPTATNADLLELYDIFYGDIFDLLIIIIVIQVTSVFVLNRINKIFCKIIKE